MRGSSWGSYLAGIALALRQWDASAPQVPFKCGDGGIEVEHAYARMAAGKLAVRPHIRQHCLIPSLDFGE